MILAQYQTQTTTSWNPTPTIVGLVFGLLVFGPICAVIMRNKGRSPVGGYFLGFLLGCIGLVIVAIWPQRKFHSRAQETIQQFGAYGAQTGYPAAGYGGYPGGAWVPTPYNTTPAVQPAGWFPDPQGRPYNRYWDGQAWTTYAMDPQTGEQRTEPL